jgi:hypothetical protein
VDNRLWRHLVRNVVHTKRTTAIRIFCEKLGGLTLLFVDSCEETTINESSPAPVLLSKRRRKKSQKQYPENAVYLVLAIAFLTFFLDIA